MAIDGFAVLSQEKKREFSFPSRVNARQRSARRRNTLEFEAPAENNACVALTGRNRSRKQTLIPRKSTSLALLTRYVKYFLIL
jgi:hypothetical protein